MTPQIRTMINQVQRYCELQQQNRASEITPEQQASWQQFQRWVGTAQFADLVLQLRSHLVSPVGNRPQDPGKIN